MSSVMILALRVMKEKLSPASLLMSSRKMLRCTLYSCRPRRTSARLWGLSCTLLALLSLCLAGLLNLPSMALLLPLGSASSASVSQSTKSKSRAPRMAAALPAAPARVTSEVAALLVKLLVTDCPGPPSIMLSRLLWGSLLLLLLLPELLVELLLLLLLSPPPLPTHLTLTL